VATDETTIASDPRARFQASLGVLIVAGLIALFLSCGLYCSAIVVHESQSHAAGNFVEVRAGCLTSSGASMDKLTALNCECAKCGENVDFLRWRLWFNGGSESVLVSEVVDGISSGTILNSRLQGSIRSMGTDVDGSLVCNFGQFAFRVRDGKLTSLDIMRAWDKQGSELLPGIQTEQGKNIIWLPLSEFDLRKLGTVSVDKVRRMHVH